MAFPTNPNPGDTYTDAYGTIWVYAGTVNGWYRQTVTTPNDTSYTAAISGPAGSNTQVQFNDNGELAGDSGLTYNKTTDALSGGAFIPTGNTVPSNGLYLPSANNVALSTNGTGRLFVDASGRVGVGAASGSAEFAVFSSIQANIKAWYTGGNGVDFYAQASDCGIYNFDNTPFLIATNSRERLRITSTGLVGIGTSAPDGLMHLASTGNPRLIVQATDSSSPRLDFLRGSSGSFAGDAVTDWRVQNTGGNFTLESGLNSTISERLRIDTAGRVGIGTASPGVALDVNGNGSFLSSILVTNSQTKIGDNGVIDGGAADGNTQINFFGGKSFILKTGSAERARIDSSGRLLVGTSSALTNIYAGAVATTPQIQLSGATLPESSLSLLRTGATGATIFLNAGSSGNNVIDGSIAGRLAFNGYDGTNYRTSAQITAEVDGTPGADDMPGRLVFSSTPSGSASPTERMSIDNAGYIFPDATSRTVSGSIQATGAPGFRIVSASTTSTVRCECFTNATTLKYAIAFSNPNGIVGSISTSGSATAYNTSSDYRLKENVAPVTDGITRLQQLKPSRFNFIADPSTVVDGFIAHEVQTIVPEAITGEKDAVDDEGNPQYQGIDQSKLVPLLTAALQEAVAKIESLEARLTAAGI